MAEALVIRPWTPKNVIVKHGINMLKYAATLCPESYPYDTIDICNESIKAIDQSTIEKKKAKVLRNRDFRVAHKYFNYRRLR